MECCCISIKKNGECKWKLLELIQEKFMFYMLMDFGETNEFSDHEQKEYFQSVIAMYQDVRGFKAN